jgi:hypothetical protein
MNEQQPLLFEANTIQNDQLFWIALLVCILAAAGAFLLLRKSKGAYRSLLALLSFILALLAGGTALFSKLTSEKIGTVRLGEDFLETPYGKTQLEDIRDAYIEMDQQPSLLNPGQSSDRVRLLIILEDDGKTHVLSEANYPIEEILREMRNRLNPSPDG